MRQHEPELPGGLVTFLFTDIEGSTRLHEHLGEAWAAIAERHDGLLGSIVRDHGGVVVKWLGDGVFAAFADAAAAVRAATAIPDAVAAEPWGVELRLRAGLHTGPAQPRDGDYTALAVHVAARVCGAAHGGQVLASADVPGTHGWTDQGEFALSGLDAPVRLLELPCGLSLPPRAKRAIKHNVPTIRTSFVGRLAELDQLAKLVRTKAVVSVLGPGGTGKTRLAFEFARRTRVEYADGAWVVLLADLPVGSDIAERVATTIGVRPPPGGSLRAALAEWCTAHDALIVLDNCEHVVPAAAQLVDELLGEASRVRFVVTSREPLRVRDEVSWQLGALPDTPGDASADAVLLFLDRAQLARPDIDYSGDAAVIAELCGQLDCLPLTIELAAARLRHMSLAGLLANVRDRLGLLRGRAYGVDERHQSLRAVLDWSHDLLPDDERATLRRCAVFHSSFTAAAAAAVCDLSLGDAGDVLERLADRSLLQVTADLELRFRMLWTIRDYAIEHLRDAGEETEVARRHADFVTATLVPAARGGGAFEEADATTVLALFGGLYDDSLAALAHFAEIGDSRLAELANAMFWYWLAIGAHATGARWLRLAGERGDARALGRAGTLVATTEPEGADHRELIERAVALARTGGDEHVLAECLVRLAAVLVHTSAGHEGERECLDALLLDAAPRDRGGALMLLGIVEAFRGDYDAALTRWEGVRDLGAARSQVAIAQSNIADILIDRGETRSAAEHVLGALPVLEVRQAALTPWLYRLLHRIALAEGDVALAEQWLDRGLRAAEAMGATQTVQAMHDLKAALR